MEFDDSRLNGNNGASCPEPSQLEALSDEELVALVKNGHTDAMTPLYRRHCRLFTNIAYNILQDRQEAQEIVQEIFLEAYQKIDRYDPAKGKVKIWLMQFVYSRSLNRREYLTFRHYYNKELLPHQENGNRNGTEPHHLPDHLEGLTFEERTRIIREGISRLPEKQRRAIELACFESLMMKDIAVRMNETVVNVRNHYYRGLRRLRQIVDEMVTPRPAAAAPNNNHSNSQRARAPQPL